MRKFPLLLIAFLPLLVSIPVHAQCTYSVSPLPASVLVPQRGADPNPVLTVTVTAPAECSWRIGYLNFAWVEVSGFSYNGTYSGTRTVYLRVYDNQSGASQEEDVVFFRTDTDAPFATIPVAQRGRNNEVFPQQEPVIFMRRADGLDFTRIMNVRGGCSVCYSPQQQSSPGTIGGEPGDPAIVRAGVANFVHPTTGTYYSYSQSLYRDPRNGENFILYYQPGCSPCNFTRISLPTLPNPGYSIAGIGDFNHDKHPDVVWRNPLTGATAVWLLGAVTEDRATNTATIAFLGTANLPWLSSDFVLSGVDDFDNDGYDDILWHNATNGNNALWMMNGTTLGSIVNLPVIPNLDYQPVAVGDYDATFWPDIVWRNTSDGRTAVWIMKGTSFSGTIYNTFTEADPTLWGAITGPK